MRAYGEEMSLKVPSWVILVSYVEMSCVLLLRGMASFPPVNHSDPLLHSLSGKAMSLHLREAIS